MSRTSVLASLAFLACGWIVGAAEAQLAAKPSGPLTCHKQVCPLPTSSCQVRESEDCVRGGGPPRCPAIIDVADGTSCSDGNLCTTGDSCAAGVCAGGAAVACSSTTDVCSPTSGCATPCGPAGCTVAAENGYLGPTLTVPAGALTAEIGITMRDQGGDANNSSVFHVYRFGPNGTTFATPATVDLPAPPLATGEQAVIEVSDDGITWTAVATTLANGRVSGPIAHFSSCRTRAFVPQAAAPAGLVVVDMVDYQDLAQRRAGGLVIPSTPPDSCYSGDLYGLCFKIQNQNPAGTQPITSTCGTPPTPTNPPPAGCVQMHVVPWKCSVAARDYPTPFDPNAAGAFEGQHCDINAGPVLACPDSVYNMDQFLPAGGLQPGQSVWVDLNFFVNSPAPANGVYPYSCFGDAFIGVDLLFREPTGSCAPGAKCDWQAGIRSARDGPSIEVPNGTNIWVPAGVFGCTPAAGATTCQLTCTLPTCSAKWEWLVNHEANYPSLRCGSAVGCPQFQPGDVAIKNWLNDARF